MDSDEIKKAAATLSNTGNSALALQGLTLALLAQKGVINRDELTYMLNAISKDDNLKRARETLEEVLRNL